MVKDMDKLLIVHSNIEFMPQQFDVLIIGSGLAGLTMALQVADTKRVCLVSKREISDSASSWSHGGISAVLNCDDTV